MSQCQDSLYPILKLSQQLKIIGVYLIVHFCPLLSILVLLQEPDLTAFQRSIAGPQLAPTPRMLFFHL